MAIQRYGSGNSLVDVLDRVLDKGIVIDAWIAVSVIGIELITIEARVIVASVETYAKYAQLLGYLGPIAGGIRQPMQRKSLGEGLQDLNQGLQGVTQSVQGAIQSLPLLGNQSAATQSSQSPAKGQKRQTKKRSTRQKSRTK